MSNFVKHIPCPSCGSRDANSLYDDDHTHCFSCGHRTGGRFNLESIKQRLANNKNKDTKIDIRLPSDSTPDLPYECRKWLEQYELTESETKKAGFLWSEERSMMIIPVYGEAGQLLLWQGRYFPKRKPKYFTRGNVQDTLVIYGSGGSRIVLVEDSISAIKVARLCACSPLYGSSIGTHLLARLLGQGYRELIIWLDKDKTKEAIRFQQQASALFDSVSVVSTDDDPKQCSMEIIKKYLDKRR